MNPDKKLEICKQTRKYAAESLLITLQNLLPSGNPISEVLLRDAWLTELRKNPNIFPDGWYMPPPHGMIILCADDKKIDRVGYTSARPEENWPKDNIFLDRNNGLIYVYASPVDKESGIIGDFGLSIYFGNNPEIKNLLKTCLILDREIFNFTNPGMKLSELALFAENRIKAYGMQNNVLSITDKSNDVFGHTVPASYESWSPQELALLKNGNNDWTAVKDMISKKRIFENNVENFIIKKGSAITIEPRPKYTSIPNLPAALSYHTIAIYKENGEKELLTNFDELFKYSGMDYML